MKQLLILGVALALLGGCSQSTPSSEVSQSTPSSEVTPLDQNSSADSLLPANTETVVLNVPGMT